MIAGIITPTAPRTHSTRFAEAVAAVGECLALFDIDEDRIDEELAAMAEKLWERVADITHVTSASDGE